MQIPHPFDTRARHGYALMVTLVFLAITLMTLASLMWWASSNGKVTQQNELFTTAEAAAEAATEQVVATLDRDWTYGQTLQDTSIYAALVPTTTSWGMQFQFSDGSGNNNKTGITIGSLYYTNQLGSTFANLAGYVLPCTITSTAIQNGQLYSVPATLQELVNADIIPLFQFAIFYNLDMDVSPGQPMNIGGNVFSNGKIWMWPYAAMVFSNNVDAAGVVTNKMQPYDQQSSSGYVAPTYKLAGQPVSKVDSLTLPIGTNNDPSAVEAIINLPPGTSGAPNAQAYTTNGQMYLFNESDIIISNAASGLPGTKGTNITIWFQDKDTVNKLNLLQPDVTNVVGTVTNKFFSFVTNVSYYDFRESDTVQAVQIDVGKFNAWLTNSSGGLNWNRTSYTDKGNGIRSIYVYNSVKPVSGSPGTLPAVRLVNGAQLTSTTDPGGSGRTTSGLTFTTPQPLYVKDDYNVQTATSSADASSGTANTAYTYPAALMADSITVLSGSWNDTGAAYQPGASYTGRNASSTTINAACLEGIVQSTNSGGNHYSGGIENFLRLEENWSGDTLTYNGSIVVMFPSIYATSFWQVPGNYYGVPTRHWGFDVNFTNPNKLPPLTPKFYRMVRASWIAY